MNEVVEARDQVKTFVAGVGDESLFEDVEGADVVTGNGEGACADLVVGTDAIDHGEDPNKASQFTAVGVSFFERARYNVESDGSLCEWGSLQDKSRSAITFFEGGITDSQNGSCTECLG